MELNNKSLFREKCFVNGQWSDSKNGNTIEVNNPATIEIIGKVPANPLQSMENNQYALCFDSFPKDQCTAKSKDQN